MLKGMPEGTGASSALDPAISQRSVRGGACGRWWGGRIRRKGRSVNRSRVLAGSWRTVDKSKKCPGAGRYEAWVHLASERQASRAPEEGLQETESAHPSGFRAALLRRSSGHAGHERARRSIFLPAYFWNLSYRCMLVSGLLGLTRGTANDHLGIDGSYTHTETARLDGCSWQLEDGRKATTLRPRQTPGLIYSTPGPQTARRVL